MSKKQEHSNLAKNKELGLQLDRYGFQAPACSPRLYMNGQRMHRHVLAMDPGSKPTIGLFMPEISAEGLARVIDDRHVLMDEKPISMSAVPRENWVEFFRKEMGTHFQEEAVTPRENVFEIDSMLELYPDCVALSNLFGETKASDDTELYTPPNTRTPRDLLHMKQHGALDRRFKPQQKQHKR